MSDSCLPVARLEYPDVILAGYRGSKAHGTFIPSTDPDSIDDVDWIGVIVRPIEHYYGLDSNKDVEEFWDGPNDVVLYELVKFVGLMKKCNPNVLATLWAPSPLIARATPAGQRLIEIRDAFLSKQLFQPFVGYARSQLHRMINFGNEKQQFKGKKRKELIDRFGYDCKNACHLIRILRMGVEILSSGVVRIDRTGVDAAELISIKRGEWKLAEVQGLAETLFAIAEGCFKRTTLPEEPDHALINRTVLEILRESHA